MLTRKCIICGCDMKETATSINTVWGDYKVTIDGVKAYVCPECGEKQYNMREVAMIQELGKSLSEIDKSKRPELLNLREVADLLRLSGQTIYNMIKDGRLKPIKVGREWRFMRKDIESLLDNPGPHIAARSYSGAIPESDKKTPEKTLKEM